MSNIDKQAVTAKTKELASLMVERFSMNPVSCKLLNEAWKKEFPDEVAIAERMLALLYELEHYKSREERVTKLVLDNSTSWDALYKKLEAAEKRIAELDSCTVTVKLPNGDRDIAAFRIDPTEGPSWLTFRCEEDLRENGVIGEFDSVVPLSVITSDVPKRGEVVVTVSGLTGSGKSAIAGEIEIAMRAIGVPVH
ncbi:TPA: hypothetical protein ACIA7X_003031 [Salmonella enterica subsp. enterica serovar Enteritidis]